MMVYVMVYLMGLWYRSITGQHLLPLIGLGRSEFGLVYATMAGGSPLTQLTICVGCLKCKNMLKRVGMSKDVS